jgi:ABC-type lipoprotein export system ATPase subunit
MLSAVDSDAKREIAARLCKFSKETNRIMICISHDEFFHEYATQTLNLKKVIV